MIRHLDDRDERATRWLGVVRERTTTIEPEWWLRLECGQVLDEER